MKMRDFLELISNYDNQISIILFCNIAEMMDVVDNNLGFEQYTKIGYSTSTDDISYIFSSDFLNEEIIEFRAVNKDVYAVCFGSDAK